MNTIKTLLKVTKELQKSTKRQVEATQLSALYELYLVGSDGLAMYEVGDKVGVSGAAAGRMAATMSERGAVGTKMSGWGLVVVFYDPARPRANIVKLTPKGIRLMEKVVTMLEKT